MIRLSEPSSPRDFRVALSRRCSWSAPVVGCPLLPDVQEALFAQSPKFCLGFKPQSLLAGRLGTCSSQPSKPLFEVPSGAQCIHFVGTPPEPEAGQLAPCSLAVVANRLTRYPERPVGRRWIEQIL